jgi:hypothetical protein
MVLKLISSVFIFCCFLDTQAARKICLVPVVAFKGHLLYREATDSVVVYLYSLEKVGFRCCTIIVVVLLLFYMAFCYYKNVNFQILVVKVSEATRPLTCKRHKGQKFELNMRRWPVIKYRLGRLVCRERLLNKHDRENPQIPSPPNHQSGSEELGIETHNRSLPAGPDRPAHDWPTSTTGAPNTIRRDLEGSHRAFLGPPPDPETPPERQVRIVPLWADSGEAAIGPL